MISITPNLRFVKPLTKYTEKRIRMFGRQRFADTYTKTGSNQKVIVLPWTPDSADNLEIYLDSVRLIDNYTVSGATVTLNTAMNGRLDFVSDKVFPDMGEKWLVLPIENLLHSDDTDNTAYGTDRREGPQVATHAKPICITQGAIGFCRPGADNDTLLYCSYYGMFGRDSVTFAIKTDMGQLSDYRCIDIRVRDPNYIPEIRLCAVSAVAKPIKANGVVVDIVPDGNYQIYGAISTGQGIQLPNKVTDDELTEYHFIVQGKDENGDWFELTEYFDPDEYTLTVPDDNDDFAISYVGTSELFGFENAVRISLTAKKNTQTPLTIKLRANERDLFTANIFSSGVHDTLSVVRSIVPGYELVLNRNPDGLVFPPDPQNDPEIDDDFSRWNLRGEWISGGGLELTTEYQTPYFETRNVQAELNASVSIPFAFYDPVTQLFQETEWDVSKDIKGSFTTAEGEDDIVVVEPDSEIQLTEAGFFWSAPDPYSPMYKGEGITFFYRNHWRIL